MQVCNKNIFKFKYIFEYVQTLHINFPAPFLLKKLSATGDGFLKKIFFPVEKWRQK